MQGRVFTLIMSLSNGLTPLGLAIAGPVADALGMRFWFGLAGAVSVALSRLISSDERGKVMSSGRILRQTFGFTLVLLFLTGCGGAHVEPTTPPEPPTTTPTPLPPTATATPTPTAAVSLHSDEQTPTPPEPSGGEVEIRIPFDIFSEGEPPPADVPECVNTIPFRITRDGSRSMMEGEGQIDCHFVDTPQGVPITYNVILEFDGVLNGELLPATPDKPSGWVDAYLTVDGTIVQYYTDYPPEATNPCPESNPCRTPTSDVIPLPFDYQEGSRVTTPWVFILHLR